MTEVHVEPSSSLGRDCHDVHRHATDLRFANDDDVDSLNAYTAGLVLSSPVGEHHFTLDKPEWPDANELVESGYLDRDPACYYRDFDAYTSAHESKNASNNNALFDVLVRHTPSPSKAKPLFYSPPPPKRKKPRREPVSQARPVSRSDRRSATPKTGLLRPELFPSRRTSAEKVGGDVKEWCPAFTSFGQLVRELTAKDKSIGLSVLFSFDGQLHEMMRVGPLKALLLYRPFYTKSFDLLARLKNGPIVATLVQAHIQRDVHEVIATLVDITNNHALYKELLYLRDDRAQEMLDLMQDILDLPTSTTPLQFSRTAVRKALLRLSRTSCLHPRCLTINNLALVGAYPVAGGTFADVWRGQVGERVLAVKVLRMFGCSDRDVVLQEFLREALIWCQLSHPNLLPFHGMFRMPDGRLCLLSPWMEKGNVVDFLKARRDVSRLQLAYDVAQGVAFLHSQRIVHGDLKGMNILITAEDRACIADFGLSHLMESQARAWTSLASHAPRGGTARWQAPELISTTNTFESDVYAMASVFYEIFTGQYPFTDCPNDVAVMLQVQAGVRPARPLQEEAKELTDNVWDVMRACWAHEPGARMSAGEVVRRVGRERFLLSGPARRIGEGEGKDEFRDVRRAEGNGYLLCPSVDDVGRILRLSTTA